MANGTQTSSRFRDEIGIVPSWVFSLAAVAFVSALVLMPMVFAISKDNHAPPFAVRVLLGAMVGTVLGCFIILIAYINRDAGRRRMSSALWTLIAILIPNGLGIVLYFVLRKPRAANCPHCAAEVEPGYSFCPRCSHRLQPVCPRCQRSVNMGDKFCPYCGGTLDSATGAPLSPAPTQT
jgi:hypothetical protein